MQSSQVVSCHLNLCIYTFILYISPRCVYHFLKYDLKHTVICSFTYSVIFQISTFVYKLVLALITYITRDGSETRCTPY